VAVYFMRTGWIYLPAACSRWWYPTFDGPALQAAIDRP